MQKYYYRLDKDLVLKLCDCFFLQNNCFFWTAQFLSLESYVVPPPTPAGSVVVDIDT